MDTRLQDRPFDPATRIGLSGALRSGHPQNHHGGAVAQGRSLTLRAGR